QPFTSCTQLVPELGEAIHVVWAFSKDFGASGLRCGVLLSENQRLLQAMDALGYWACVSGHTQFLLGEVISDQAWVDTYLAEVRESLRNAYRQVTEALGEAGIPYVPAEAGFFLLCDFRSFLPEPTWEAEHALWRRLLDEANVNLTPGHSCHIAEPGFLRLCFASVSTEAVVTGVRRLAGVVSGHDS
ncbi:MAG: aminotransferase class I/II-fold pyridoxal phosphate-dependent enzyme, partial [Acidobacteriota bacterium]